MFRRVVLTALLVSSTVALLSCSSTEPQEPYYRISVEGVVSDAVAGEPMAGIRVWLLEFFGPRGQSRLKGNTTSNEQGFYAFSTRVQCDLNSDNSGLIVAFGEPWEFVSPGLSCTEELQVRNIVVPSGD
ncbi:MAG: hypothetical protein WBO43_03205 [Gemmatimonadota bacterium]